MQAAAHTQPADRNTTPLTTPRHLPVPMWALCTGLLTAALGGCASTPSPTDGYAVDMLMTQRQMNMAVFYELRQGGDYMYNAGRSIISSGDPTAYPLWTATLTREQAAPIVEWLKQAGEPEVLKPEDLNAPVYRVRISRPGKMIDEVFETTPTAWTIELRSRLDAVQKQFRPNPLPYPELTPKR